MDGDNPYSAPATTQLETDPTIRKVSIRPIELFRRGHALLGNQYWLFFGITVVGILIGSMIPMGLIVGAMMVGIFLCFLDLERGVKVEFATVFRGFEQFVDSLVATLIMVGASLLLMLPAFVVIFALIVLPVIAAERNGVQAEPPVALLLLIYPVIFLISFALYIPFLFTFQLIADRKLKGFQAVWLSARAAWKNLFGVAWFLFVNMFISILLAIMCYLPALFFMPISFAAIFLLYRDIFPRVELPVGGSMDITGTP